MSDKIESVEFYNGISIPILGFGVYNLKEKEEFENAVNFALKIGYRHFDTASVYGNESMLGNVVKNSGLNRNEVFVTTKLWKLDFGFKSAIKAFDLSLMKLNMEYVDLYIVHWPQKEKLVETWAALEHLYSIGKVKSIGVSNFSINNLDYLMDNCSIKPMVNQIEHHPFLQQNELVDYCFNNKIKIVAHSPLMWGNIVNNGIFKNIAIKYNKTIAQIVLRWNIQKGIPVIPKSSKTVRIVENSDIFDFSLDEKDIRFIDGLDENCRIGGIPTTF